MSKTRSWFFLIICIVLFMACLAISRAPANEPQANPQREGRGMPPGDTSLADVTMDPDGTLHWGPRVIPPNLSTSPESRRLFIKKVQDQLAIRDTAPTDTEERRKWTHETFVHCQAEITAVALKTYPNVIRKDTTMAGIPVIVFSAKDMPERNKNRVALEFEIDAEGVELAGIGKMTVISVKYNEGTVTEESHRQIVRDSQKAM